MDDSPAIYQTVPMIATPAGVMVLGIHTIYLTRTVSPRLRVRSRKTSQRAASGGTHPHRRLQGA